MLKVGTIEDEKGFVIEASEHKGIPRSDSFPTSLELDDLARAQGVVAIQDIQALFGIWPGDPDDGFEELIDDLRNQGAQNYAE